MEKQLEFQKKMLQVHKPNRVNPEALATLEGTKITAQWKIVCKQDAGVVLQNVAKDLQEYFAVSMNLELQLVAGDRPAPQTIFLTVDETLAERSFRLQVADGIIISGVDERYAAQGSYAFEDELNINEAPIIAPCDKTRKMRFSFRCINSGMPRCEFPDEHLRQIAHSGMTAITTGVRGADSDPEMVKKVNDIVDRAAKIGLDVYCFPSFRNTVHPDDAGAFEHYDTMYGELARNCPNIKGYMFVGEVCEFPSRDPRTTGKSWRESKEDEKSSPGWFPCNDYNRFVALLRDVLKASNPTAEIVFWTYNWGYEKQDLREALVRSVPTDITMMATFEMFEEVDITPEIQEITTDYTLWQIGPGKYYSSEAQVAKERNVRMYCMSNGAGNTWDIGGVPYLPAPQRWIQRWKAMTETQDNLKMDGIRDSHSYGYWPSFLVEMSKYAYMLPAVDMDELLDKIIIRDFGKENLQDVKQAFALFSEGMSHCVSTNEDQFGPARVGPSYPLFYKRWELIPDCPEFKKSVNYEGYPIYTYNLDRTAKLQYETEEYIKMDRAFNAGLTLLAGAIEKMDGAKKEDAMHILQVAQYLRNNARTIHHVKRWHYLKGQLGVYVDAVPTWPGGRKNMVDAKKAEKPLVPVEDKLPVVLELVEILKAEIENAKDTIPLVEANSRLGFEQEYGYSCCKEQIEWKIRMAEQTLKEELLPMLEL